MNTRRTFAAGLLALAALPASTAFAQQPAPAAAFPTKPVTLVTPFAAGSGPDAVLRTVADRLTKTWNQRVIVENRPGGGGFIAIEYAQRAAADGYVLLQLDSEHLAALPHLYRQRNFQPLSTFEPVASLFRTPFMVVVSAQSPWKNMQDLVNAAKAKPGQLNYGSWAVGSPGHLGGELLEVLSGVTMQHVPYKEVSQLFASVGNNDIDWSFGSIPSSQAAYRFGKVKYLAVAAPKRVPAMPEVPTVAEAGGPAGLDVSSFVSLVAPRGVPAAVSAKIGADVAKAIAEPEVRARFEGFAFEPITWTPAEIQRNAEARSKTYSELIRKADIKLD